MLFFVFCANKWDTEDSRLNWDLTIIFKMSYEGENQIFVFYNSNFLKIKQSQMKYMKIPLHCYRFINKILYTPVKFNFTLKFKVFTLLYFFFSKIKTLQNDINFSMTICCFWIANNVNFEFVWFKIINCFKPYKFKTFNQVF